MTPIPPDAKRYVIAAVVGCDKCAGTGRLPAPKSRPPATYTLRCHHCDGEGERVETTDIEVEPDDATSGHTTVRVWLEVRS